jgi:histidinol phosphatase-like enzyme (inositol monophosphatase family)
MTDLGPAIALAERLADAAAAEIRARFRQSYRVDTKPDVTPVTEADRAAEQAVRAILAAERPDDGIAGEEFGAASGRSGLTWVVDPIDGTKAFMSGRPTFATLIALLDATGRPVVGVIDQPIVRDRWVGAAGRPTTLNGGEIRTRARAELGAALFSTTAPDLFPGKDVAVYQDIAAAAGIRTYGGDGYAYGLLAAGWIDVILESGLKLHDFAALAPVIEGAGGLVTDWNGQRLGAGSDGRVVASGCSELHARLLERIRTVEAGQQDR